MDQETKDIQPKNSLQPQTNITPQILKTNPELRYEVSKILTKSFVIKETFGKKIDFDFWLDTMIEFLEDLAADDVILALKIHNKTGRGLPTVEGISQIIAGFAETKNIAGLSQKEIYKQLYGF